MPDERVQPPTLGYADSSILREIHPFAAKAVTSLLVAALSLGICGYLEQATIHNALDLFKQAAPARMRAQQRLANANLAMSVPEPRALSPTEAEATVEIVEEMTSNDRQVHPGKLSTPQRSFLMRSLMAPGQELFDPKISLKIHSNGYQSVEANLDNLNRLHLRIKRGSSGVYTESLLESYSVIVDPNGNIEQLPQVHSKSGNLKDAEAALDTASEVNPHDLPEFRDSVIASISTTIALFLAILLLIGSVFLLRLSPMGVTFHRLYAILQIPTSIAIGICLMRMIYHSVAGPLFPVGALLGVLGCIYPIVILITLRQKPKEARLL
jgi:hypothetical protein